MDSFYKVLTPKQHEESHRNEYNFDHPEAFDFEILIETLKKLKQGRKVEVPIYNFVTHSRESRTVSMHSIHFLKCCRLSTELWAFNLKFKNLRLWCLFKHFFYST